MSNRKFVDPITSDQIRGARAMLGWSASDLAKHSGLSRRTIQNLENNAGASEARLSSILAIKAACESAGIEFVGSPDDAPGVRIRKSTDNPD